MPPRFLADAMLERLARWLRVLGVDVESAGGEAPDDEVVRRAVAEGRVLLTRDRRLAAAHPGVAVRVREGAPRAQLAETVARFGVAWPGDDALFRRCLVCNAPLEPATAEQVAEQAAPAAVARGEAFYACPRCGRVYWEGGHTQRMRAVVRKVVGEAEEAVG